MTERASRFTYQCFFSVLLFFCVAMISSADNYYPLDLGDIWLYEAKESEGRPYTQLIKLRPLPDEKQNTLKHGVLQIISNFETEETIEENYFTNQNEEIRLHQAVVHEGQILITVTYDAPILFLKFPLDIEKNWAGTSQTTIVLEGKFGAHGQATVRLLGDYSYQGQVTADENVSNARGDTTYLCRKVNTEAALTIKQIQIDAKDRLNASFIRQMLPWRIEDQIQTQSTRWLAPSIGEVKFVETTVYPNETASRTELLLKGLRRME